jgi:hypothetical protein
VSVVGIDGATGCLLVEGAKVFPLVLSNPPPVGDSTPDGRDAWAEVAAGGVSFVRTPAIAWDAAHVDAQLAEERAFLDAAQAHGLHGWLMPPRSSHRRRATR